MDPIKEKLNLLRRLASEKKAPIASALQQQQQLQNQQKAANSPPNASAHKLTRESSVNSNADLDSNNETSFSGSLLGNAALPRPNSLAYNKYINRIRSMYDKESQQRSASIEPAQINKPSTHRQSSPLIQSLTDQAREAPIFEDASRAPYDLSENEVDDDFVDDPTNNLLQANSISKYLKHAKNNGLFKMPSHRAASVENLQRNNNVFGNQTQPGSSSQQPQLELNQINRLKERFSKPDTRHASLESGNIHSNYSVNNFLSLRNDTKARDQYKSLRGLNRFEDFNAYAIDSHAKESSVPIASTTPLTVKTVEPSITYEIIESTSKTPPDAAVVAAVTASKESSFMTSNNVGATRAAGGPRGAKQLHRYQRSRTSDLTDLIFGEEKERELKNENNNEERSTAVGAVINDNYNMLVDKYATDLKYTPETAIIKSTMNQSRQPHEAVNAAPKLDASNYQNQLHNNGIFFSN
jgi:hypothetical protein